MFSHDPNDGAEGGRGSSAGMDHGNGSTQPAPRSVASGPAGSLADGHAASSAPTGHQSHGNGADGHGVVADGEGGGRPPARSGSIGASAGRRRRARSLDDERATVGGSDVAGAEGGHGDGGSDEDLFRRFRNASDEPAYEALVHRYETELFGYLKRYLGNAEMAEDVFQATFLQVYLKKEGFDEGRRFRPWLYTIATNQAIDAQRRNRRHRMVSLDQRTGDDDVGALVEMLAGRDETADERLSGEEAKQWIRAAVEDLPDTLRGALLLVYHQGLKYREAADVLGVPVGTVKSRLHSALLKLNQSWQASGNVP